MRRLPVHPFFAALSPVVFMLVHNIGEARWQDAVPPALAALAATLALWGIARLALRTTRGAALLATAWVLMFASYGQVYRLLDGARIGGFVFGRHRYLLAFWVLAMGAIALAVFLRRGENAWQRTTEFANRLTTLLLAASATTAAYRIITAPRAPKVAQGEASRPAISQAGATAAEYPDIYYIIVDSYVSDTVLSQVFGHDNSEFTGYLKSRGFAVTSRSRSNYAFTAASLASSLNMKTLEQLGVDGRESNDIAPLRSLIQNNAVMGFLKDQGYTIVNLGSWWAPTFDNRDADVNLRASRLTEFDIKLLEASMLYPVMEIITEDRWRRNTLFAFDKLGEVARFPQATFAFAHIICPHPPFVFDANGAPLSNVRRLANKTNPGPLYVDQVRFINKKLRETVDTILARSSKPPIIVIQGDHGIAYVDHYPRDIVASDVLMREQMRVLNAVYLPDSAVSRRLYDSMTPVNTFRVILSAYFGADLPLLPDRSFYSTYERPYRFLDVTDRVAYR